MRIIGLDVGDRRIGVALSDAFGWTAQGLEVIHRKDIDKDIERIKYLCKENDVQKLVVGLPKNMNASIGPQGEKVLEFVEILKENVLEDIVMWDERLTTVAAEKTLLEADTSRKKRKKVIDKVAAVFILQGYLDHCSRQQLK